MLVECVPNFSEGRDAARISRLEAAARSVAGVALLDTHVDPDHNRCVLTLAGEGEAVAEAAFRAVELAVAEIDLREHEGVHPRIGAADVVPFVPLGETSRERCVELALGLADRLAAELELPVYLYGHAAQRPERAWLPWLRQPGLAGLDAALQSEERAPDRGPARAHERAGACVVGARDLLLAYNVDLASEDLALAKRIAKAIRTSSGGLPGVQAKGLPLPRQGRVQVSMNLFDLAATGPGRAYGEVARRAAEAGVEVARSELVGLMPEVALCEVARSRLLLDAPLPERLLEARLRRELRDPSAPLPATLEALAGTAPDDPGGGSAAALTLALAQSCLRKALGFSLEQAPELAALSAGLPEASDLLQLARDDHRAWVDLLASWQLPKDEPSRKERVRAARAEAVGVPEATLAAAERLAAVAARVASEGNRNLVNDAAAAAELALAAARIARLNARANSTRKARRDYAEELEALEEHAAQARAQAERD